MIENFDSDPARSWTLPGHYYFDADIYRAEMKQIFYRNWQYVCHISAIPQTGDYHVRDIGDQSVFVLRQENGDIVAYHNVCQHRAHRLLEDEGKIGKRIVCPYHAWAYAPTGELLFARGSEGMQDFPKCEIHPYDRMTQLTTILLLCLPFFWIGVPKYIGTLYVRYIQYVRTYNQGLFSNY